MKKLYRKGTVHPSPPIISDQLSFLPATILTLTAALSSEDKEVLAYLIFCSSNTPFNNFSGNPRLTNNKNGVEKVSGGGGGGGSGDHPPLFNCNCFRCYMSYWVRWDESPNRQLLHEIIDAFEDWLAQSNKSGAAGKNGNNRKDRKNKHRGSNINNNESGEFKLSELMSPEKNELGESESVTESSSSVGDHSNGEDVGVEGEDEGSVRKFVNFIGERIWGVWNQ
ncbi:putative Protein F12F1.11 [Quillaja saponaria]|uniref:Uncharacterized protein n=1 Tax=Quillaja saponaria TaxID=32244 RepID=A0AAD7P8H4_QUISA|nr:putative Protein F12F1.11 [Quillaja saponaria]